MEARPDDQPARGTPQQLSQQRPASLSPRFPTNESGPRLGQPPANLHRLDSRTSLSPGSPQFPPPRQFPPRLQTPPSPGNFQRPPQGPPVSGRFPSPGSPGIRPPYPGQRLPFNPQIPPNQIRQRSPLESSNSQLRFAPPRIVTNNEGLRTPRDLIVDKMEDDKIKRPVSRTGDEEDDDDDVVMDDKESVSSAKENVSEILASPKTESPNLSPKPSTPIPTPSPKAATPVPIPSPKAVTPVPSPSPKATTPVPPSPKATTPVQSPTPKATTPIPSPSPKATTPIPPSPKAATPVQSSSPKATTPVQSPSPKATTPVQSPSPKAATPVPSPKAITPVPPSPKAATPAPTPSPKAVTPVPSPSPKAGTPISSPSPKTATPVPSPSPVPIASAPTEDLKSDQEDQSRPSSRLTKSPTKSPNLLEPESRSITPSSEIKGFDNGKPRPLTPSVPTNPSPKATSPLPKSSESPVATPAASPKIPSTPVTASPKSSISPKTPGTPKDDKKKTTFADDTLDSEGGEKIMRADTPAVVDKPDPPQCPIVTKSMKRSTSGRSIKSEAASENGTSQPTGNGQPSTNGVAVSPTKKTPTKPKTVGSPIKSPSKSIKSLPRTPDAGPPSTTEKKKVPMNKVQVGAAPSPNLKTVRSKIGSLDNASYRPGGGKIKIENRKLDFSNAQPKIAAKNDKYMPSGGDKKITQVKLQWNAKPKVGSLDNATYKPGGGDKKIETIKVDFKDKAKPKVGSKDNAKHVPGGGTVKSGATTPKTPQEIADNIETQKIDIKAESKIGSMDNMKHKPGGGDKKIFDDKDYLRQMGGTSNAQSVNGSGTQSPVPSFTDGKNGLPTSDENLNQEY